MEIGDKDLQWVILGQGHTIALMEVEVGRPFNKRIGMVTLAVNTPDSKPWAALVGEKDSLTEHVLSYYETCQQAQEAVMVELVARRLAGKSLTKLETR